MIQKMYGRWMLNNFSRIAKENHQLSVEADSAGILYSRAIEKIISIRVPKYSHLSSGDFEYLELRDIVAELQIGKSAEYDCREIVHLYNKLRLSLDKKISQAILRNLFLWRNAIGISHRDSGEVEDAALDRMHTRPRICIKINTIKNGTQHIADLFRQQSDLTQPEFPVEGNSGFIEAFRTGKNYRCDNIPLEISHGKYKNVRIKEEVARDYYFNNADKRKLDYPDIEWNKCWKTPDEDHYFIYKHSFYKSTLIVPISIGGDEFGEEFYKVWYPQFVPLSDNAKPKLICAYVCADSVFPNYFKEEDELMIECLANVLSSFFVLRERWLSKSNALIVATMLSNNLSAIDN